MENTMLFIKYALFFALEFAVVVSVGAVLIGGIYQLVRDAMRSAKIRKTAPETKTIA
ncbi:MAG: hypothetical protein JXA42_17025 [Anaerolineales bacterium]|nr:hypothetical protein [Anaerolineales bacterium]